MALSTNEQGWLSVTFAFPTPETHQQLLEHLMDVFGREEFHPEVIGCKHQWAVEGEATCHSPQLPDSIKQALNRNGTYYLGYSTTANVRGISNNLGVVGAVNYIRESIIDDGYYVDLRGAKNVVDHLRSNPEVIELHLTISDGTIQPLSAD
jgi:hypothetical protein